MLITTTTRKTLEQLKTDLPKAAAARSFGVLATLDLKEKLREKGLAFEGEALVFEVCNPRQAMRVLEAAPEASAMLPCRISVWRAKDGTLRLSTVRPTALVAALGAPGLEAAAREVEEALAGILEDAAR
jgi:uncharacterized protein (DUF302 family)